MQKFLSKLPENFREKLTEYLLEAVYDASASGHRRVLVYATDSHKKFAHAAYIILAFHHLVEGKKRVLYAYEDRESSYWRFMRVIKKHRPRKIYIKAISLDKSRQVLGETFDAAVIDLTYTLFPNDLGILVDTVKGGGIILILLDSPETWLTKPMKHLFELASLPYTELDVKRTFEKYFLESIQKSPGFYFLSRKKAVANRAIPQESHIESKIRVPDRVKFDRRIYKLCATNDQAQVLKSLEDFYFSDKRAFVVTANRGRGKSAAVGLFLGALGGFLNFGRMKIGVTAPSFEGTKTLFEFVKHSMSTLGEPPEWLGNLMKRKNFEIKFYSPMELTYEKFDLVVVDEASGIPVPMLFKILQSADKVVFSTTIHGYEGAGRGFNIRFLKRLKEGSIAVRIAELKTPIRYQPDDPIEKWLYDLLLLDAEPEDVKEINIKEAKFSEYDREDLFFKNRDVLRKYIGIYILAHYRNEPNDVLILADAPHIHAAVVRIEDKLMSSLLLAEEGVLPPEICQDLTRKPLLHLEINGHVIPSVVARYYENPTFPCFRGLRIVRIAVHPAFFNQGIGSISLKKLENFYKDDFDWFGASFGATPELLNFWFKNGYYPIYISPVRNAVSGEYSVAYVKAVNTRVEEYILEFNETLMKRLVELKDTNYLDVEADLFLTIIKQRLGKIEIKREIDADEVERVKLFRREIIPWGYVRDIARKLGKLYFLNLDLELSRLDEIIILENFIHLKELGEISKERRVDYKSLVIRSHELFNILFDHYYPRLVEPREFPGKKE